MVYLKYCNAILSNVRSDTWLEILVQLIDRMHPDVKMKFNSGYDYEYTYGKRSVFDEECPEPLNSVLEWIAMWTKVQIQKRDVRGRVSQRILERVGVKRNRSKNVQVGVLPRPMSKWVEEFEPASGLMDHGHQVSPTRVRRFSIDYIRSGRLNTEIERFNKRVGGEYSIKRNGSANKSPTYLRYLLRIHLIKINSGSRFKHSVWCLIMYIQMRALYELI